MCGFGMLLTRQEFRACPDGKSLFAAYPPQFSWPHPTGTNLKTRLRRKRQGYDFVTWPKGRSGSRSLSDKGGQKYQPGADMGFFAVSRSSCTKQAPGCGAGFKKSLTSNDAKLSIQSCHPTRPTPG